MVEKFNHWKNVCKIHWKEIVTLSVALHTIVDFILWPTILLIGVAIGMNIETCGHGH